MSKRCFVCNKFFNDDEITYFNGGNYCNDHYKIAVDKFEEREKYKNSLIESGKLPDSKPRSYNRFYELTDKNDNEIIACKYNGNNIFITDIENKDKIINRTWIKRNSYPITVIRHNGEDCRIPLHRFLNKTTDKNEFTDHKNGIPEDMRMNNMRLCNAAENRYNALRTVGEKRVDTGIFTRRLKDGRIRYFVEVKKDDKSTFKSFKKKEDAIEKKKELDKEKFGEFAVENRVNDGVYDEIVKRIKSAKPVVHFDDPKLEKQYNFTDREYNN